MYILGNMNIIQDDSELLDIMASKSFDLPTARATKIAKGQYLSHTNVCWGDDKGSVLEGPNR